MQGEQAQMVYTSDLQHIFKAVLLCLSQHYVTDKSSL